MSKGVLGNDPFKRGAADRAADSEPNAEQAPAPQQKPALPDPRSEEVKARVKGRKPGAPFLEAPNKEPQKTRIAGKKAPAAGATAAVAAEKRRAENTTERKTKSAATRTSELDAAGKRAEQRDSAPPQIEVAARNSRSTRDQVFAASARGAPSSPKRVATETVARAVIAAAGLIRAVRAGLGATGAVELDAYGRDPELGQAIGPIADFLYERYWRVAVTGAERLPNGPCILVANHSGALPFDGPVLHAAIKRERPELAHARWLVEDQIFYAPVMGTLLNRLGAVRANPENALRLLEEGRPLIVFPEGIHGLQKAYAERYQLKRFGRGGFVKIALQTNAPIVPVAIVGAEETSPLLARIPTTVFGTPYLPVTPLGPIPLPAKWRIRIGAPFTADDLRAAGDEESTRVQRGTELTREAIQGMLEAVLRERSSAFR